MKGENIIDPEGMKYLWINVLASVLYLISGSMFGMFKNKAESISSTLKALSITYAGVVIITFFVRDLAYSRLGLIFGFILGVIFFLTFRILKINSSVSAEHVRGKIRNSRIIIVGEGRLASEIVQKIHSRPDWTYEVVGIVGNTENEKQVGSAKYLGSLPQLRDLVKAYNADQVFFALKSISYKQMLKEISRLQREDVVFKLIPDSMDFILGKSKVEYLEAIPLVEVEFDYSKPLNKLLKRLLDLSIALPCFILLFLITWPSMLSANEKIEVGSLRFYEDITGNRWKNWLQLFGYVVSGKLSLVGSPITGDTAESQHNAKKGITGITQISENKISGAEEQESFELYYLQNYSIWMDIDILVKTIFNGPSPLRILSETAEHIK